MKLEAGSVLVIETGEYSDYSFVGPFRVLKAFDQAEVAVRFREEWKPGADDWRESAHPDAFPPWLVQQGYIEDFPNVVSWHVGSYGRFTPEIQ